MLGTSCESRKSDRDQPLRTQTRKTRLQQDHVRILSKKKNRYFLIAVNWKGGSGQGLVCFSRLLLWCWRV